MARGKSATVEIYQGVNWVRHEQFALRSAHNSRDCSDILWPKVLRIGRRGIGVASTFMRRIDEEMNGFVEDHPAYRFLGTAFKRRMQVYS